MIDAGDLSERLELLELEETQADTWEWVSRGRLWAQVEVDGGKNLFSSVGIGARNAKLVLRTRPLSLCQALRWRGQHLFLTGITKLDRMHLNVQAALVNVVTCLATRTEDTVGAAGRPVAAETMRISFPGILTEKYARYEREETHAENDTSYVLVVPKEISLQAGDLVTVQDGPAKAVYAVTICHVLDQFKNEYEIARRGDV
ncbi:hypothetical protein KFE19_14485 [Dysosmobacter sp. Marseille-Q4140]|nr:hypothetical protein KFE19_14485 [Dysosmobacter sp. Marseille-Q4140]